MRGATALQTRRLPGNGLVTARRAVKARASRGMPLDRVHDSLKGKLVRRPAPRAAWRGAGRGRGARNIVTHARTGGALPCSQVYRSSDAAKVDLPSLWKSDEKAVVAFARSMG